MIRRRALRSAGQSSAGPPTATLDFPSDGPADWEAVEDVLALLARSHAVFSTATSSSNWISNYEPGRRLMLESGPRSNFVQIEHVKTCWETFERLGRIHRRDVLEPGRCSAFMMAVFERLPGVSRTEGGECLVLLREHPAPQARTTKAHAATV